MNQSILEIVNSLNNEGIGNLITSCTAIVAIIALVLQSRSTRKQIKLQNYIEYTKRYQEIILNFPENINEDGFELSKLESKEIKDKTMRYMRAYFDLCFEEFTLHEKNYIDYDLWVIWKGGINVAMSKSAFQEAWKLLMKDTKFGKIFEKFIADQINTKCDTNHNKTPQKLYDKGRIKDIFDNIKNIFACAGVLYAGAYSLNMPSVNIFNYVSNKIIGITLILSLFLLLNLNAHHFVHVFFPNVVKEKSKKKLLIIISVLFFYFLAAYNIVFSIVQKSGG